MVITVRVEWSNDGCGGRGDAVVVSSGQVIIFVVWIYIFSFVKVQVRLLANPHDETFFICFDEVCKTQLTIWNSLLRREFVRIRE